MTLLVSNASGIAANDNATPAVPVVNRDPVFVAQNLLTTVYVWATTWDTASVQIMVSPQTPNSQVPTVWFPVGAPIAGANGFVSFQHRWGQIKAVVSGASASTAGLYSSVFDGIG